jgi:hypothetical protein
MRKKEGRVHRTYPLLLYRRLASYYLIPCLLLLVVSLVVLVWGQPALAPLWLPAMIAVLLSVTLVLLTWAMSRMAYVRCGEDGLLIQVPLQRVHVPYRSIIQTRTSALGILYPPSKQPFSTRAFLRPLWHLPAVVVELELLPQPRRQLRLWMDSRMLLKSGLVLLVEDHRGLRSEIEDSAIRWRLRGSEPPGKGTGVQGADLG